MAANKINLAIRLKAETGQLSSGVRQAKEAINSLGEGVVGLAKHLATANLLLGVAQQHTERLSQASAQTKNALKSLNRGLNGNAKAVSFANQANRAARRNYRKLAREYLRTKKTVEALRKEVNRLSRELNKSTSAIDDAAKNLEDTAKGAEKAASGLKALSGKVGALTKRYATLKNAIAAGAIGLMTREIWQAGVQMDRFRIIMGTAIGDMSLAGREMAFVERQADKLGQSLEPAYSGYAKLKAAIYGTPLENQARALFEGISQTIRAFRMSTDDADGVWRAFVQILSKGKVQAEELRGQLGERIPGAFRIAAEAIGVTQEQLNAMMDRGEVYAEDFIPKFIRRLNELTSVGAELAKNSPDAALNRLGNAFFQLKAAIANSGIIDIMTGIVEQMTNLVEGITNVIRVADRSQRMSTGAARRRLSRRRMGYGASGTIVRAPETPEEARRRIAELNAIFDDQAQRIRSDMERIERLAGRNRAAIARERQQLLIEKYKLAEAGAKLNQAYLEFEKLTGERPDKKTFKDANEKQLESIKEYIAELNAQRLAIGLTREQTILYEVSQRMVGITSEKTAQQVWQAALALADETKAAAEAAEAQKLYNSLMQEDLAQERYQRNLNLMEKLRRSRKISDDQYQKAIDKLTERYLGLADAAGEAATSEKKVSAQASRIAKIYQSTAEGIANTFTDTFKNIFSRGLNGFEDFGKRLLNVFRDTMARMATMAIAKPVIIPMVTSIGGIMGVSKEAMAQVTSELGGAGAAGAVNPMIGLGVVAGGLLIGGYLKRKREREQREKEAAQALSLVNSELRMLTGASTETAERLRQAGRAISEAESPLEYTKAIIERYRLEKQLLNDILNTIESLSDRASQLLGKIREDRKRITGQRDFRDPGAILGEISAIGETMSPGRGVLKRLYEKRRIDDELARLREEARIAGAKSAAYLEMYPTNAAYNPFAAEYKRLNEQIADQQNQAADLMGELVDQLDDWVASIDQGIQKLDELRAETLRYYEAQKRLSEQLSKAVQTIDEALAQFASDQRIPTERLRVGMQQWRASLETALTLDGEKLASAAQGLSADAAAILSQARDVYASGRDYSALYGEIRMGLEALRERADKQAVQAAEEAASAEMILGRIEQTMNDVAADLRMIGDDIVKAIDSQKATLAEELRVIQELLGVGQEDLPASPPPLARPGRNNTGSRFGTPRFNR